MGVKMRCKKREINGSVTQGLKENIMIGSEKKIKHGQN